MDPVTMATLSVGAHLLTESGSALVRARDLLELADWPGEDGLMIRDALEAANRGVQGVRMLVDGHIAGARARGLGELEPGRAPPAVVVARELVRAEVAS